MGEIGEYWREHREYQRRRDLGMSERQYERFKREAAEDAKPHRCPTCGKRFGAIVGQNDHARKKGCMALPPAPPDDDWTFPF